MPPPRRHSRPPSSSRPRALTVCLGVFSFLVISLLCNHALVRAWPRPASDYLRPRQYTVLNDEYLPTIANISDMGPVSDFILNFHDPKSALAKLLVPRPVESTNLKALQSMIKSHFSGLSSKIPHTTSSSPSSDSGGDDQDVLTTWHLQEDTFTAETPYGPKSMTNLVFTHDPLAEKKFVLAAHIDSKFFPSAPMNGFVGATDSAVPCAIMLDIASSLNLHLNRLAERWQSADMPDGVRTTLQLVFLDGEEAFKTWTSTDSIYGARHLAEVWDKPVGPPSPTTPQRSTIQSIDVFVLLDLIGAPNPTIRNFYLETGWLFDSLVHAEARLGAMGLLWDSVKGEDAAALSGGAGDGATASRSFFEARHSDFQVYTGRIEDDHLPFLQRGVPILHVIPVPFPRVWHTLGDDASAIDLPTIQAWSLILRVVTAEYLDLFDGNSDDLASSHTRPTRDELASPAA